MQPIVVNVTRFWCNAWEVEEMMKCEKWENDLGGGVKIGGGGEEMVIIALITTVYFEILWKITNFLIQLGSIFYWFWLKQTITSLKPLILSLASTSTTIDYKYGI